MRTYKQAWSAHGKIGLNALLAGEITSLPLRGISNEFQRVNFMIIPLREKRKNTGLHNHGSVSVPWIISAS